MEAQSPRSIILDIKGMIKQKNLSVPDILKLLEDEGEPQSETTIRRLVKDGSEDNDSFNFSQTIKPIADAFYRRFKANDDIAQTQIDLYRHISEFKLAEIHRLQAHIEHLERTNADQKHQIDVKDRRMDEQAKRCDHLMERNDKLSDALIDIVRSFNIKS
jgi:hypothetical protein